MKNCLAAITPLLKLMAPSALLPAALAALASALCALSLMGAAAWLITTAALQPPLAALALGITIVRACGIGRAVFRYADRYFSHRLAFDSYTALQLKLYDSAAAVLPLREGPVAQGQWLHRLTSGCQVLRDFYLRALLPPLVSLLLILLTTILLFPVIGLMSCLLPLLFLAHLLVPLWRESAQPCASQQAAPAYRSALLDTAEGRDELQLAGSLAAITIRLDAHAQRLCSQQRQDDSARITSDNLLQLASVTVLILLLASLSGAAIAQTLSFIELAVWLLILLALQTELPPLAAAARSLRESKTAALPLWAVHSPLTEQKTAATPTAATPLLAVNQLTFGYHPEVPIFNGLSFTITTGQHTAVIGDSGSGKTTLACLLTACWPPDSGSISLGGLDAGKLTPTQQRSFFAACLQGCQLPAGTIRSLFSQFIPGISDDTIQHCLQTAQLTAFIHQQPQGLDTELTSDATNLSGGQRSRLLTALSLARPAPILLLDEPTAGLDAKTSSALLTAVLDELDKQQRTLLVITHDPLAIDRVSQVIRL
ncbi:ATP-binding cassette, subfamily C [Selenomonas sp. GACV-9]|uniref:amino acid ABC transporter ATP-binding/permease protein n=1 Tax=Selenomonas sp. GACV-9 TaxID=3158782 RepID=UPI0008F382CC|nr:ATP-binding cassette, subfamily C [Selenomonas ruminantium]